MQHVADCKHVFGPGPVYCYNLICPPPGSEQGIMVYYPTPSCLSPYLGLPACLPSSHPSLHSMFFASQQQNHLCVRVLPTGLLPLLWATTPELLMTLSHLSASGMGTHLLSFTNPYSSLNCPFGSPAPFRVNHLLF